LLKVKPSVSQGYCLIFLVLALVHNDISAGDDRDLRLAGTAPDSIASVAFGVSRPLRSSWARRAAEYQKSEHREQDFSQHAVSDCAAF
jgi:hypothetical protein